MGFGRKSRLWNTLVGTGPSLNALTGIDGFWTHWQRHTASSETLVLMPLRALMGFGLFYIHVIEIQALVLMPLRALMGFGPIARRSSASASQKS